MRRITSYALYWMLPCFCLVMGCVNLRSVNAFSTEAVTGLAKFEEFPFGFTKTCELSCVDDKIRAFNVTPSECDCNAEVSADSITRLIYSTTLTYFEGLMVLSGDELTEIHTAPLTELLSEGSFGPVELNEEQLKAYSQISSTLLRVTADGIRREKLRNYIVQSQQPLQVLLEFLDFNLSGNLSKKLEIRKLRFRDFYFDLSHDTSLSAYERLKLTEDYYQYLSEIETLQNQITTYSQTIRLLIEGHNALAGHTDELNNPEFRKHMFQYAADIHTLLKAFQSL